MLRKEIRYALARYVGLLVAALPFLGLTLYVFTERHEPIRHIFSGPGGVVFVGCSLAGLAAIQLRRRFLHLLDRRFFHEDYDPRLVPVEMVEKNRLAGSIDELGQILTREISRALRLTHIAVFTVDSSTGFLVSADRTYSPLSRNSPLAKLIAGDAKALEINKTEQSLLQRLPHEDRRWLQEGLFQLLIPILGSDRSLLGTIALGEKKTEQPFSNSDRQLLTTIAASVAFTLETRFTDTTPTYQGVEAAAVAACVPESDLATECQDCLHIYQPGSVLCERCGGDLRPAPTPYILGNKFRLEERIGLGGMGVVYRAFDLSLGRIVAIKTLPSMSPDSANRLRSEARVVAMVQHPHLALIYGVETWRGIPMLVFEYVEGGTLRDRLWTAPVALYEALELGMVLVDVLDKIHAVGILHRDIKPGNIGFTKEGKLKLLDFGLAHVLFDSQHRDEEPPIDDELTGESTGNGAGRRSSSPATKTRNVVGTPAYLSPESLQGVLPDPSFDLWGTGIVLYEALTGFNPLRGETVKETLARVRAANIPDIREKRGDLAEPVAQFFRVVLSRNRAGRPNTAMEMRAELERLKKRIRM